MTSFYFVVVEQLLQEISKNKKIQASVSGAVIDGVFVGGVTTVGGLFLGPIGALGGAVLGTAGLAVSKAMGYGQYKALMDVLREDLTEAERQQLYTQIWEKLKRLLTDPRNIGNLSAMVGQLLKAVQNNPVTMQEILDLIRSALKKKNYQLSLS